MKSKILFVCIHNSARSQMAEALFNSLCGQSGIVAESAGLEPGKLNPLAVEAMAEIGIDISAAQCTDVFDLIKSGRLYSHVITVCDETSAERCPIFTGVTERLHWSFADPSSFKGTHAEKLAHAVSVRDEIRSAIEAWCDEHCLSAVEA